jgi:DNA cross-link repair 1C protein
LSFFPRVIDAHELLTTTLAETWWVNSLTRNPVLIPYACGLKTLDTIYLDTTFAVKSQIYRTFPPKSAGIQELLEKVKNHPQDTIFYLRAWTFGYEEVWQALSIALNSKV